MALQRTAYKAGDVTGQSDLVLSIAEQLKGSYKGSVGDPANTALDVDKSFAPSHLFFTDKDLYYSEYQLVNPAYVNRFLDFDLRAPYRGGNYKRTEVGVMYPVVVKDSDVPTPGQPIVGKRREPVNIGQDESAPIPDIHYKNYVDFRLHEFKAHFLDSDSYSRTKGAVFDAMRKGNAAIEKLWIDAFIANILQVGSYPRGDRLFKFFAKDDTGVPEDSFSKVTRGFYLKDNEMKKSIIEFGKGVRKYYVNRIPYLTNPNHHEVMGQALDTLIPKWDEVLVDRSDENKILSYLRSCYLAKDNNNKFNRVGYGFRRQSIQCLGATIFGTLRRMMTDNAFNGCGHKYGTEVKDNMSYDLRCRPENLVVFMNGEDLDDMRITLGSQAMGPFTEQRGMISAISEFESMGVTFYPVNFVLPGMAVVLDTICFRLVEYFNESYSDFFPFELIDATVHHMFKKPVLYRYTACTVIELGKDQKYAVPLGGASEHLPLIAER